MSTQSVYGRVKEYRKLGIPLRSLPKPSLMDIAALTQLAKDLAPKETK